MKITVKTNKEEVSEGTGGGGWINSSGIYPVEINFLQVAKTKNGAFQVNLNVTHQDQEQTIYGPIIINKNGDPNEITMKLMNRLAVVAGYDDGTELETTEVTVPLGKDQVDTEIDVIEEFSEVQCFMRVQMEYSKYNNEIQERKSIKTFYRLDDKASAGEIVADDESAFGNNFKETEEKYADNVTYKDGLDEETVAAWIASKSSGGNDSAGKGAGSGDKPKKATAKKKKVFGKKAK